MPTLSFRIAITCHDVTGLDHLMSLARDHHNAIHKPCELYAIYNLFSSECNGAQAYDHKVQRKVFPKQV